MHANRGVNTLGRRRLSAGVHPVVRSVANCVELARCGGITLMQPKIGRNGLCVAAKAVRRCRSHSSRALSPPFKARCAAISFDVAKKSLTRQVKTEKHAGR